MVGVSTKIPYILGWFVVAGKEYQFFARHNEILFNALLSGKNVRVKDVSQIFFYDGEPKNG